VAARREFVWRYSNKLNHPKGQSIERALSENVATQTDGEIKVERSFSGNKRGQRPFISNQTYGEGS
jgi:hypothetical protein